MFTVFHLRFTLFNPLLLRNPLNRKKSENFSDDYLQQILKNSWKNPLNSFRRHYGKNIWNKSKYCSQWKLTEGKIFCFWNNFVYSNLWRINYINFFFRNMEKLFLEVCDCLLSKHRKPVFYELVITSSKNLRKLSPKAYESFFKKHQKYFSSSLKTISKRINFLQRLGRTSDRS